MSATKIISAIQAHSINQYNSLRSKVLKCCAHIYFKCQWLKKKNIVLFDYNSNYILSFSLINTTGCPLKQNTLYQAENRNWFPLKHKQAWMAWNNSRYLTTTVVFRWFPWQSYTWSCDLLILQWSFRRWGSIWNESHSLIVFIVTSWQWYTKYCLLNPPSPTVHNITETSYCIWQRSTAC
jgi:hypothetical protein